MHPNRRKISLLNPLGLPSPLTWQQVLLIVALNMIIEPLIEGAIQFGIAYGMYHNEDKVTMWVLNDNTIAGDIGVTIVIRTAVAWYSTGAMLRRDIRVGNIPPFPAPWPNTKWDPATPDKGGVDMTQYNGWRTFNKFTKLGWMYDFGFTGTAEMDLLRRLPPKTWFLNFFISLVHGFFFLLFTFAIFWPLGLVVVAPHWSDKNMAHSWTPEIMKICFGFVLAVLSNILIVGIHMGAPLSTDDGKSASAEPPAPLVTDAEKGSPQGPSTADSLV